MTPNSILLSSECGKDGDNEVWAAVKREGRGIPYNFEIVTLFHSIRKIYTKLEVFVDKTVRGRARTQRGNTRGGATKKREI